MVAVGRVRCGCCTSVLHASARRRGLLDDPGCQGSLTGVLWNALTPRERQGQQPFGYALDVIMFLACALLAL